MKDIYERALEKHSEWKGKLKVEPIMSMETMDDLALAYSPGVAAPCLAIEKDPEAAYAYTMKGNLVAVISDGSAVLGLGDIGPDAAMPVMEGKCCLFRRFGGVNAIPLVIAEKDPEKLVEIICAIAPSFGGINLEDISSPRCVEIERALIDRLSIPVFHDDQHGTAIVTTAGLINALRLVGKKPSEISVVVSGAGAAGSSIVKLIRDLGVKTIYVFDSKGVLRRSASDSYSFVKKELAEMTNEEDENLTLAEAMKKADVFLGVSVAGILTKDMVRSMNPDAIVFAMANPEPEISYEDARAAGARVVGTGRSDYPNQVNNILAFPGIFKGALEANATKITDEMKLAAARGIASLISDEELAEEHVIPNAFDSRVSRVVADAVAKCAMESGLIRNL